MAAQSRESVSTDEQIVIEAEAGTTYYVQVEPLDSAFSEYTLDINQYLAASIGVAPDSLGTPLYTLGSERAQVTVMGPDGAAVAQGSLGSWAPVNAVSYSGGFKVLWKNEDNEYAVWTLDHLGAYTSGTLVENVADVEPVFDTDLNDDGALGFHRELVSVGRTYSDALYLDTNGDYWVSGAIPITINEAHPLLEELTQEGASLLHVRGFDRTSFTILGVTAAGEYVEFITDEYGASDFEVDLVSHIVNREEFYDADINGDGTVGHAETVIEDDGLTRLVGSTEGYYYLEGSDAPRMRVTQSGEVVGPYSLEGWSMLHAEINTAQGGYTVLWEEDSGILAVWDLDEHGAYQSGEVIDNIRDYEVLFQADVDGDGTIGYVLSPIDNDGSIALSASSSGAYTIGLTIEVTQDGRAVGPDTLADWSMLHAERNELDTGYAVLWQHASGTYAIWDLDETGAYQSGDVIDDIKDYENLFQADVDGDGTIGYIPTTIEATGNYSLVSSSDGSYYMVSLSAPRVVEVTQGGTGVGPDTLGGWSMLHADLSDPGTGFTVLWQHASGTYAIWVLDETGAYQSGDAIDDVRDYESMLCADLDADGTLGHIRSTIEATGDDSLVSSTDGSYYIVGLSSPGVVEVTRGGTGVGPDTLAGWSMLHADRTTSGDGFVVLWQDVSGTYAVWTLDDTGAYLSGEVIPTINHYEELVQLDVNEDEVTGHVRSTIAPSGTAALLSSTDGTYYVSSSPDTEVQVTQDGEGIGPDTLAGWTMLEADRNMTDDGYIVLWQSDTGTYAVWSLDETGAHQSGETINTINHYEELVQLDVNGDGAIGHVRTLLEQGGTNGL